MSNNQVKLFAVALAGLLSAGCQSSERHIAYQRGTLDIAAEKYGWLLPKVDRIEISALTAGDASATTGFPSRADALDGVSYYRIDRQKTIIGEEAKEFRDKWRSMTFWWGFSGACHEPAYGLRFFEGQRLVLETTLCWKCSNFEIPTPLGYRFMGFDEEKPQAKAFWKFLQEQLPLAQQSQNLQK